MNNPSKKSNPFFLDRMRLCSMFTFYVVCIRYRLPVPKVDQVRPGVLVTPRFFIRAE
jgi:hypothetical protein